MDFDQRYAERTRRGSRSCSPTRYRQMASPLRTYVAGQEHG
jgi:hypothetical protein